MVLPALTWTASGTAQTPPTSARSGGSFSGILWLNTSVLGWKRGSPAGGTRVLAGPAAGGARARPELHGRRLVIHEARSQEKGTLQLDLPQGETVLAAAAYRIEDGGWIPTLSGNWHCRNRGSRWRGTRLNRAGLLAAVASQPHDLDYLNPMSRPAISRSTGRSTRSVCEILFPARSRSTGRTSSMC